MRRCGYRLLMLAMSILCALPAWGACSTSSTSDSFGSVPSTRTDQAYQTRASGGLRCTGASLQFLDVSLVRATITGTTHDFGLVNAAGDRIPYRIYADAAFNDQLVANAQYDFIGLYALNLGGLFGGPDNSVPLYARTQPTRMLSAGVYRDVINIRWDYSVCTRVSLLGVCVGGREQDVVMVAVELTITITPDCLINAPDVRFGAAPLVSGFSEINQSLSLFCTRGSSFQVGLSQGSHPQSGERHMASSSGELLRYRILKPDGTPWRDVGSGQARSHLDADRNPGPGLGGAPGTGGDAQGFDYRAVIDADQTTPSPGVYTDQVVVTVQF
ncbi:Spore coat protein U (SCPU) domain-containing protein [Kushneria avicenniae]|uniref:Spore coat protein U (SCPU) domain-containing protein n=1 Tax=Kushneria avicenniae TaxID=402385 RepID=A0A1I1LHN5_9GAMM|nr:spore coat U domain-containing protein [Kushneria avicenniae]SFC72521.1 Spore coat protein U (SCPU) domain-containing protein [Kushneria avicenniae]